MGFKNKNHKTESSKAQTNVSVPAENTKPVIPNCIAGLKELSASLSRFSDVPENCQAAQKKIATNITKLADRIHKGLGAAAKKAEREASKAKRAEAKTKRDEAKKTKKLEAIKVLKEKLAKMEADVAPADDKK